MARLTQEHETLPLRAMMTPYEKLKSLPNAEQHLKQGMTFQQLDAIAQTLSDNEAAKRMNEAKQQLFRTITEQNHRAA